MAISTIYLKNNGIPFAGVLVGLAFKGGGMTKALFTDRFGKAKITHAGSGTAQVLLNGQEIAIIETTDVVTVEI
jgi:hypothetical protein